jgi:hypothetical protein
VTEDVDEFVPVHRYLLEQGFTDVVAVAITLHVLIKSAVAMPLEIIEAAEELGYSLPDAWQRLNSN